MSRRANAAMMPYRKFRANTYRVARVMGNLQPFGDYLATGDIGGFVQGVTRRWCRRLAGRAFSRSQYGISGGAGLLWDIAVMILGHFVGLRGRR